MFFLLARELNVRHPLMATLVQHVNILVQSHTGEGKRKDRVGCEWRENDHVVTGFGAKILLSLSVGSCSVVFGR